MLRVTRMIGLVLGAFCSSVLFASVYELKREDGSPVVFHMHTPDRELPTAMLIHIRSPHCHSVADLHLNDVQILANKKLIHVSVEAPGIGVHQSYEQCPPEFLERMDLHSYVEDHLRVVAHLRANMPLWDGRLFLMGEDEGSFAASEMASVLFPEKLLLLGGGVGDTIANSLPLAQEKKMRARGDGEDVIRSTLAQFPVRYQEILSNPTSDKLWLWADRSYFYWSSALFYEGWNDVFRFGGPTLVMHAELDEVFPVESSQLLYDRAARRGLGFVEYRSVLNLSNGFIRPDGTSARSEVLEQALNWFLAN